MSPFYAEGDNNYFHVQRRRLAAVLCTLGDASQDIPADGGCHV